MLARLARLATPPRVFVAFLLAVAFSAWLFSIGPYAQMQEHGGILDERFGSTPAELEADLDGMGAQGRSDYRVFLVADMVFPALHGAWVFGFLAIGRQRWKALPIGVLAFPLAAVVADWLENVGFLWMVAGHPEPSGAASGLAFVAMHVKLLANALAALAVVAVLVWYVMNPVDRKGKRVIDR